jgi:hypothetical protein
MDPPHAVPGVGDGALLDVVPGEAIDALVAVSGADTPLLSVELRHLGGALGARAERPRRPGHAGGRLRPLRGRHRAHAAAARAIKAQLDVIQGAICEWDAGRRYLNFTESAIDTRRAFSAGAYRRLQAVKTLVDPTTSSGPTTRSRPSTEHTLGGNAQLRRRYGSAGAAAVEGVEAVGVLLVDDVALDLQRRRQLAGLLAEVVVEDEEALDLLDLGVLGVGRVELGLDQRAHLVVLGQRGDRGVLDAVLLAPGDDLLLVERDRASTG